MQIGVYWNTWLIRAYEELSQHIDHVSSTLCMPKKMLLQHSKCISRVLLEDQQLELRVIMLQYLIESFLRR